MRQSYIILAESSCDLSPELISRADVEILPMPFTMEGKSYHHPGVISLEEFYKKMKDDIIPTTAAANVADYSESMEKYLKDGKDVLFLCLSSGLSSSFNACSMAVTELRERYADRKIYAVDTLAASCGQGLLVLLAGEKRLAGASIEEVRDFVEDTKFHLGLWFTVEDLKYLKRGGRISSTAAVVGSMLNIKPVLRMDDEGHLIPMEKVRGRKAAIQSLLRHMEETAKIPQSTVLISQAVCRKEAEDLRRLIIEKLSPKEVLITDLGPIIGAHTGPGLIAVFFTAEHR